MANCNLMQQDIQNRILNDFGGKAHFANRLLENFIAKEDNPTSRIIRALVKLSAGNIDKLKDFIQMAEVDWRDVIYMAEEYEYECKHPFKNDFNNEKNN